MRGLLFVFLVGATAGTTLFAQSATKKEPLIIVSPAQKAASKNKLKSVVEAINDYLAALPEEEEWSALIAQFGPIYGNYCGPAHGDSTYEQPCLSQLDCMCKEHDFGYSLRKYREADQKFAEVAFGVPLSGQKKTADYEDFIKVMAASLFAGRISGEDLYAQILAAHEDYKKEPQKAKETLAKLIDENEVFKSKIDEIRQEKTRFEDAQAKLVPAGPRRMAVAIQPFNALFGIVALNYEIKANNWLSFRTGISFLGAGLITETYLGYGNDKDFSVFGAFGSKFYAAGEVFKNGVYIEPRIDFGYENVIDRVLQARPRVQDIAFVPAILLGFDKVFASGIQLDVGVGVGYYASIWLQGPVRADFRTNFFVPKFQASIGYAW